MSQDASDVPPLRIPEARLDPSTFELPVDAIRSGRFSDKYFVRSREILLAAGRNPVVTMQAFQKDEAWVGGVDEALAILRLGLTEGYAWSDLEVKALRDGQRVLPWEPVLEITGPYPAFSHLETLYLGALARRTAICTNTRIVVEAAWPRSVLYFPARHDHWSVQAGDGYAAWVAGATGVSTDAQAAWWQGEGLGTVPHALIAAYGGDTVAATEAFARHMPDDIRVISLVDFDNHSVETSLAVARSLGSRLWGVRLDTSATLVDRGLWGEMGDYDPTGVNPPLVRAVRQALDDAGREDVNIVVSGGFTADKVRQFEAQGVPVDSYGVGSSLVRDRTDYTADVVKVDGEPLAKVGRSYRPNPRLDPVP